MATNYVPYGTVYWDQGYRNYEVTQGLYLQKATHDFDYMMFLMGSPIVRVSSMWNVRRVFGGTMPAGLMCSKCDRQATCLESPQNRYRNGSGGVLTDHLCVFGEDCGNPETGTNEDCSSSLVEFASGVHGVYTQVFFTRRNAGTRGATISGYHGTVQFDWYTNKIRHVRHHENFTDDTNAGEGLSHFGGDAELAYDYLALIKGTSKRSRTPIETGVQSVYSCLAARESAQTGKFVQVRQVGQA
jgi:predicted dehydrogenase